VGYLDSIPNLKRRMKMTSIKDIEAAARQSLVGLTQALSLIHSASVKAAAHTSLEGIEEAIDYLAELADDTGLEDKLHDHPDFISRSQLEREVNYCTTELYGENYVKVMDLYDLFTLAKDPAQATLS
jgi:hypothetical protein